MGLRVTLGHSVSDAVDLRELQLPMPEGQCLELEEVAAILGFRLRDAEGGLLVLVNERLCSPADQQDLRLCDGDHLALYRMVAGG